MPTRRSFSTMRKMAKKPLTPSSLKSTASPLKEATFVLGIDSSGFQDLLLKPQLLRAIVDSGFEQSFRRQVTTISLGVWNLLHHHNAEIRRPYG
nr:ATP-dependent RNA helicase SUB2-1-like isoform X1 [Coffea arabica]